MSQSFAPYTELINRTREISYITATSSLLGWDQETYMPPKAIAFRADQLAYFSGKVHQLFTAPEVGNWIKACEDQGFQKDSDEAVNIREWRRAYDREIKLPHSLVEELSRTASLSQDAWIGARAKSDFSLFKPWLQKTVDLKRKVADLWGYKESPYDALLDVYEPAMHASQVKAIFAELRPSIVHTLEAARERSRSIPENILHGHYPIAEQIRFNEKVARAFGFDFEAGRIDSTTHPFCTGLGPCDSRLTTRYKETDFTDSLYSVLHECGHGLYDQGLRKECYGTPSGDAVSLGIHESQSRFWENHIGRSLEFWKYWFPIACDHFPELKIKKLTPEKIYQAVTRATPSFIRVEADEVTYDLHIILRFELESRLIEGTLKVDDVPAEWNSNFESMFGLRVDKDANGCLQDVHWSMGGLGYFPTYTLGNLNASQIHHRILTENPALWEQSERGEYSALLEWLRTRIHQHGMKFTPQELMQTATSETTKPQYHLAYLHKKYSKLS